MAGIPSEAEIQTQWQNSVALLESARAYADGTVAGAGGKLDVLIQSLEGTFTPASIADAAARFRSTLSSLIDPSRAQEFLLPVLQEYSRKVIGAGGYADTQSIMRGIYEWFIANSYSIKSRAITYDTSATLGGSNVGNGAVSRLTVDENGKNLEACTVEEKLFRCRADANSGAQKEAELFEVLGDPSSIDALSRASYGTGGQGAFSIRSLHAGSGAGGSILRNSSFSTYSATASPKFSGWTETAGGASVSQDTANYYRDFPGSTVSGSLKIAGGAGTVTLTQNLADMARTRIDPENPYFLRVMVNKTIGTASGGNLVIRMGAITVTTAISALSSGWVEVIVPLTSSCWFRVFNQLPFKVQVEWASSTSGYLLVDDILFAPFTLIDGTYWVIRGNAGTHVAWKVDDTLGFTDTGGAPTTAKLQWWLWIAGLGYLPSSGSPTITDPA